MSIIFFPSNFIYYDKITNHNEIKEELLPKILESKSIINEDTPFKFCLLKTSFLNKELNNKIFYNSYVFLNMLWNNIDKVINEYNKNIYKFKINIKESILDHIWYNIYTKGCNHHQEFHSHNCNPNIMNNKIYYPSLSGIYILHDNNTSNNTIFKTFDKIFPTKTSSNTINTSNIDDISEGTLILFPSVLQHCVKPVLEDRITIAFNIYSLLED